MPDAPRRDPPPASPYLVPTGAVIVPARICAMLNRYAGVDAFRRNLGAADREAQQVLIAMRRAELDWTSSATGTRDAEQPEQPTPSEWVSTTEAARILRITDRGVRAAIARNHLHAERINGRWRIQRTALAHYAAAHTA